MLNLASYMITSIFLMLAVSSFHNETDCIVLKLFEGLFSLWNYSKILSFIFLMFLYLNLTLLDDLIWFTTAIFHGFTLREI